MQKYSGNTEKFPNFATKFALPYKSCIYRSGNTFGEISWVEKIAKN